MRAVANATARLFWRVIPLSPATRGRLAGRLFRAFPAAFAWTPAYRAWKAEEDAKAAEAQAIKRVAAMEVHGEAETYLPLLSFAPPTDVDVRTIAFYLPQFHPIPENDEWWGDGFTEWANVRAASPQFENQLQPRIPGELGYYDLMADDGVMNRQAELARLHGVSAFCFYFYWFAGKRLLEGPIKRYMEAPEADLPFCLCWANENWSRRWDGRDDDLLITQDHSPDDDLAFIGHIAQYLRDPRYLRINGRPVLLVYRPALLPNAAETVARWRDFTQKNGIDDLYLICTESFETGDPAAFGFDAATEFAPNNMGLEPKPHLVTPLHEDFACKIYDWRELANRSRNYAEPDYKLFRSVTQNWDNTPRRGATAGVLVGATPSVYELWLANAAKDTRRRFDQPEERLIFVNAWNEWAEGAYLEPDTHYGYAWLEATRRALSPAAAAERPRFIIVTHDLRRHGAQNLALNLIKTLKKHYGASVATIALGTGDMAPDFAAEGPLQLLNPAVATLEQIDDAITRLKERGFDRAIVNSAASGGIAEHLARHRICFIGLIHEMSKIIDRMALCEALRSLNDHAEAIVFPAALVRDSAASASVGTWRNAVIQPQGIYKPDGIASYAEKESARRSVCQLIGADPDRGRIVLGVGFADHRKGVDIFIRWAISSLKKFPHLHFVWLGATDPEFSQAIDELLELAGPHRDRIHFPGYVQDTAVYYRGSALYALSSREDPFPSTVLEALVAGTPVIMVDGATGATDFKGEPFVAAIPDASPEAFVAAAESFLTTPASTQAAAEQGVARMQGDFGFASYAGDLARLAGARAPAISAVVPNYNYAGYLEKRLRSILDQTLAPREIIILDDASTDESIAVARRTLKDAPINWRVVTAETNSGSVFAQWRKAAREATSELLWIAEADDWADPRFLEMTARTFAQRDLVMAFTQSYQADANGSILATSYQGYVEDVSSTRWRTSYYASGPQEIVEGLSVKNTIPNVSAALFRRDVFRATIENSFDEIASFRVAGDWCAYVGVLSKGDIAFISAPLNFHRRHSDSVTINRFGLPELAEIARMQRRVAAEFDLPDLYREKAKDYLSALVQEFGLNERYSEFEIARAINA